MKRLKEIASSIYNKMNNGWNRFINIKGINFIFKFLPHNLFLFIFFIISILSIMSIFLRNYYEYDYVQPYDDKLMDPILIYPYEISLDNVFLENTPDKVCFEFATFDRINDAVYDLSIFKGDEMVFNIPFHAEDVKQGEKYCEKIPMILNNDNVKDYKLVIRPITVDQDNALTLYGYSKTNEPTLFFTRTMDVFSLRNVIIMIFGILFLLLNYFINKKKIRIENYWLLVSLLYVVAITIIIPPYQVPDEPVHYYSAINLSQIGTDGKVIDFLQKKEINVPENFNCVEYSNIQKIDKVYYNSEILNCLKENDNVKIEKQQILNDNKLSYIFGALGYKIADIFSNSPLILFYSGRLFNCLMAILILFFAIKITPKYKGIILAIGTMPMFIQEMISYSYDSILNSCILLAMSCMLNIILNKNHNKKLMYLLLFITGIIIANIKYNYLFIYLLLLLKKDDNKKYIYTILFIIICYLIGDLFMNKILSKMIYSTNVINPIKDGSNLQLILHNPLYIIPIAFNTITKYWYYYIQGLIGYFGWFRYKFNDLYIICYLLFFIYLIKTNDRIDMLKKDRSINIIGILIAIATIFGALYFWYSQYNLFYVDGVQGRYFIPLLAWLFIMLMPNKAKFKENYNVLYTFINIVLFSFTCMLLLWYY